MENKATISERLAYLSWSKLNMWEKDPNLFYQVYIEGLDQFRTKYLELGKRLADGLENGFDVEHDPMFEMLITFLPSYPKREYEAKTVFEGIPLFAKFDGFDDEILDLGEYKSGKKWTQSMVDQSGQLTMYALIIWSIFGKLPSKIQLHWARTDEDMEGNLFLTGEIKTFTTVRTMKDIILFSKRIKTAWAGIQELINFYQNGKDEF